ncbi:ADP-ribose pyrophosphatase, mitochondrial [Anopheles aquasalis]|uniref:ADP-ribose pyrophosphatase, mitochondrial n=1 Tax=Anopheles aquasalis TaxID=42839 RepID=UPI00215A6619|nr:ADP-ribose pyrophosphatase, mitochondrial [Anopheles aquasalis]
MAHVLGRLACAAGELGVRGAAAAAAASCSAGNELAMARILPGIFKHNRCRNGVYPQSDVRRYPVPDESVFWSQTYSDYQPPVHESPILHGKPWADLGADDPAFKPKWNELDGKVNRVSFIGGKYEIRDDCPVNPFGRTGIRGRGILGRWGPNHAADPVVTRWKRDESGEVILHPDSGKRILQMCAIERQDCGEWAIPGGMVDPGEKVSATLRREFLEETMDNDAGDEAGAVEQFFAEGTEIYKGYVDDPRNTDCAWMETVAVNFHDETGAVVGRFPLHAGDDAAKVRWMDVGEEVKLYASHSNIVKRVVDMLEADW